MSSAPLVSTGPDDNGAAIVVVTYGLVILSICFAFLRIYTSFRRKKDFGWDDATFFAAIIIALPESVFTERAVAQGLGKHMDTLSGSQVDGYSKWIYTSQILGILAQCLAKVSVVFLIKRLDSQVSTYRSCRIITAAVLIWTVFSVFTIAFQCGLPQPWIFLLDKCAANGRLWYVILALDAATDVVLATFFLPVIWRLQMEHSIRSTVTLLFAARIVVCGAIIGHIVVLSQFVHSADKTWYNSLPTIFFQITVNLSLITGGLPSIHRYLSNLSTGHLGSMLTEHELEASGFRTRRSRTGGSRPTKTSKASSKLSSKLSSQLSTTNRSVLRDMNPHQRTASSHTDEKPLRLTPNTRGDFQTHIYATNATAGSSKQVHSKNSASNLAVDHDDDPTEDSSTKSLTRSGVVQKKEFKMEIEYDLDQHLQHQDQYYGQYTRDESLHAL